MKLKEFMLDIPYIENEQKIREVQKEQEISYEEAVIYDAKNKQNKISGPFRRQTRCMASMIERVWNPIETKDCWKIEIDCLASEENEPDEKLPGIRIGYCKFDYLNFFNVDDKQKKIIAIDLLKENVPKVMEKNGWDTTSFLEACEKVVKSGYNNTWVWRRRKSRRGMTAEIVLEHEVSQIRIYMRYSDKDERVIQKKLLIEEIPQEVFYVPYLGKLKWIDSEHADLITKKGTEYIVSLDGILEIKES